MIPPDELLGTALPGEEIVVRQIRQPWKGLAEQPWKRWRTADSNWAVYLVVGDRLSESTIESIHFARGAGLRPVIIAPDNDALAAVAPHFGTVQCHVLCRIAGKGSLIGPPVAQVQAGRRPPVPQSRIPVALLGELEGQKMPTYLGRIIRRLRNKYTALIAQNALNDELEQALLREHAVSILRHLGFSSPNIDVPSMLRRLESSGWGGRRDHFFHSFQNYFFGLFAVLSIPDCFNAYNVIARLHWNIDPFDVWFLTALWHDVGYGIERMGDVFDGIMGSVFEGDPAERARVDYLKADIVQQALRDISCLMARLLEPGRAGTGWMPPAPNRRRTALERNVEEALKTNVLRVSHGAASSLRLYSEYIPRIHKMGTEKQLIPKQTVLLACCSAPFHDWHFRECLREACGGCEITTESLPFASLLAFVDSIQDDRRDLAGLKNELYFLERLIVNQPTTVTAQVNRAAVSDNSLLWKVVEARDVIASLRQRAGTLTFVYPAWMVT